jgi:microcystin-dependent protein
MEGTISEIRMFAGDFAPKYWAFCQGQTLNINTNQALFALLGVTYGGNGITILCSQILPEELLWEPGQQMELKLSIGEVSGTETVVCTLSNMPKHTHESTAGTIGIKTFSGDGDTNSPTNSTLAALPGLYSENPSDTALRPISAAFNLSVAGGSQPINIRQPYLGINYIICLYGIFPSRS